MPDIKGNNKKVYDFLSSSGVTGIGDNADQFEGFMAKEDNRRKVYDYLSSVNAQGIGGSYDEFSALVYAPQETTDAAAPAGTPTSRVRMDTASAKDRVAASNARMREMNEKYTGSPTGSPMKVDPEEERRRAELAAEKAAREQDAKRLDDLLAERMQNAPDPDPDSTRLRTMLQDRMANEAQQKEENRDIREDELRSSMAEFDRMRQARKPAVSSLDEAPEEAKRAYSVEGKSKEELEKMKPMYKPDIDFVEEYEKRREEAKKMEDAFRASRAPAGAEYPALNEAKEWLERNRTQYENSKKRADEFHYALGEKNAPYYEKRIGELDELEKEYQSRVKGTGRNAITMGSGGFATYPEDITKMPDDANYFAASQMIDMSKQQYRQGNKYDPGYKGDNLERLWTGIEQFVGGAANNIDLGSFTFGASEGSALKTARNVGDKYNEVITSTLKDMGVSEQDIVVDLTTIETSVKRLNEIVPELDRLGGEIETMKATYDEMVQRGDPNADAYAAKIQRKANEYNKLYKQYEPLKKQYDDAKGRYDKVMGTIDDRVKGELSDSERAVLDAFDEFTRAKMERSSDTSTAAKAGAGAEQSAEFMLDFILTGGIAKGGTKIATKLATKRMLKKLGREKVLEMAAKGAIKPGFGLTLATDAAVSGIRTGLMFPRNLQSYSENLTEYSGKDAAGRYNFDRSHLNAALNTALTQYIEYWSEGFGEYFGAGEQALFKAVTGKAPKTAIGATLKGYRGSIGQFLDHGKFDGMLNEMLEEVVGSTFNSLAGWMSGDRVGDKDAIKEFWAGENLATLALSFLPMSAISSATNMRAYNKMKERHDMGVATLNPFIESGAIKAQDLQDLVEGIPDMTPEEIVKAIVEINDNARKANGGKLPQNFSQALIGYLEGEFAMGLRNQEWEDSREKMAVVNAYTSNYTNPRAADAWDNDQNLKAATQAAVAAGFTEDELEKDSYMIGQDAMQLRIDDEARADVLMDYATAKAAVDGLQQGYAEQTKQVDDARDAAVRKNLDVNGNVIAATLGGKRVFITQNDATVNPDGTISTPTQDGEVLYRTSEEGELQHAKASAFSEAVSQSTDSYIQGVNDVYDRQRAAVFEQAKNTVSPKGQMRAISQVVGRQVVVTDHKGVYAPVSVERMTDGGRKVVIKGDKKQMQGIAAAMGVQVPAGQYLEAEVQRLYPLLDTQEDGSLTVFQDTAEQQKQIEEAAKVREQIAQQQEQQPEFKQDTWHTIDIDGRPTDVRIIDVGPDGVRFEYDDAEGNSTDGRMSVVEFQNAIQRAQEPAPAQQEEAPTQGQAPSFPVNEETGEKIYDHPSVTPEAAFQEIMGNARPGTKDEANRLKAIDRARAGAHQDLNIAEASIAKAQREKAQVDEWELPDDESLDAFEQRKARARADADARIAELERQLPELKRKADHWDAVYGMVQQRAEQAAADKADKLRKSIVNRAKKWEKMTGVKVEFLDTEDQVKKVSKSAADEIRRGKSAKKKYKVYGWYNPKSDKVYIYTPSFTGDLSQIDKTYIHEVVSHKGLRGLLTDPGYDELCDRVWNELMTPEQRAYWKDDYNSHLKGKGHSEQYLQRAAADEFIADISERLNEGENKSLFDKIVEWVKDILDRLMSSADIEAEAKEKVAAAESISTDLLKELLADSMARFVSQKNGAKPLSTESLKPEIQEEMKAKGLEMDGGVVMDEQQTMLKKATGYKTPNELDEESNSVVGDIRFSHSTMPAWERTYLTYQNAKKHVVKVMENISDRLAADELVTGVLPRGVYKYGEKSSGSFAGPLRTNIEYIVTFDMDTSCPRSLQYLEYVKKIEAQIGRPLTQRESVQLIEMMRMYGQMIPCVYCYCENKRQALKQYFTDFMTARHAVISAKTDEEALEHMYGHATGKAAEGSKDPSVALTKAAYKVFQQWRQEKEYNPTMRQLWAQYKNDRNVILTELDAMLDNGRLSTLMSDEEITKAVCQALGITEKAAQGAVGDIVSEWKWNRIEDVPHDDFTRIQDEDDMVIDQRTLNLWREMTLYGKSASSAKNVLRYVPYTDELKTLSQEQKDFINGMGGLRMHSSNDFRIDYVLDYFQFMADMEVNGMMGHTYTKSPEFVRIFGNSGYKINMSIAAYEDSRGIHPNADEGFDWNTAKELREKFPNAGVMLMATSDNQVQMALDSDWIDMFIPFHHSGLPKEIWYQMRHWDDYSAKQNEKFLNGDEMRSALKDDGVEVPKGAKAAEVEKLYNEHFGIRVEYYKTGKDKGKRIKPHFLPGPTVVDGVVIPGHNNDYQTYIDLCRQWGVHPRFYGLKVKDNTPEGGGREVDITEHPQYMKCIKETARTDTPQTAIRFNFDEPSEGLDGMTPIDYAIRELEARAQSESELVGSPVRSIYESYKQDPYGIVPQFINTIIKHKEETGEDYPLDYLTPDSRKWFMTERRALEDAYKDFDTIPYHPHEYDEDGNLIMTTPEGTPETAGEMELEDDTADAIAAEEGAIRTRKVEDPAVIEALESGEWENDAYRAVQFVPDPNGEWVYDLGDGNGPQRGNVYPPMSAQTENGTWRNPIQKGVIEQSEEAPERAFLKKGKWVFRLHKGNGKYVDAAYNPYIHSSDTMLNDQFSEAQSRGNLVVMRVAVPKSELDGDNPYQAEKAKDHVGRHDWKAGPIQGELTGTRTVYLSRYDKPMELVPIEKVAESVANMLKGQVDVMPTNVVWPQLRNELEKLGMQFAETDNQGKLVGGENAGQTWKQVYGKKNKKKSAKPKLTKKKQRELVETSNAKQKQPVREEVDQRAAEIEEPEIMFRLSKNNRATVESWLNKRTDISDEERESVVNYIDDLDGAKLQLATARWYANGAIRLPEDMPKVKQAISVADKAKVDPLMYPSPMALLDAHADFKPTEERINPDAVSTLHKSAEYPEDGITVYDVDESEESRRNMRKIINTHYGKDASPWCLLQGDGEGNLTPDSKRYWRHYDAYPKQVAFKDGKLLAFSANDSHTRVWWDRTDTSHYGIPVTRKIEGDELGRSTSYILSDVIVGGEAAVEKERLERELAQKYNCPPYAIREHASAEDIARLDEVQERINENYRNNGGKTGFVQEPGAHLFKGNRQNGVYEEWGMDGERLIERTEYKDGKENGVSESWFPNGQQEKRAEMKDDHYVKVEFWYDNGNKRIEATFDEDTHKKDGKFTQWWSNGNKRLEQSYKNGEIVGESIEYGEDGKPNRIDRYDDNGELVGYDDYRSHYRNSGKIVRHDFNKGTTEVIYAPSERFRKLTDEEEGIKERAQADGTFMKAPNGKPTNLNEEQWLQVRTLGFKRWFGNWDLKNKVVNIVNAVKDHGFQNFSEARKWAKDNIVGPVEQDEVGKVNISGAAVEKYLSEKAVDKSDDKDVHLSTLRVLPDVIRESVVGELHPDNEKNPNVKDLVRLYGCVDIDGKDYRVKTTLKRYNDKNTPNKAYSYEVTEIELLEGLSGTSHTQSADSVPTSNNSITAANLLNNVQTSNGGANILDSYSKVVDENGEPLVVWRAGRTDGYNVFDENRGANWRGFYFTNRDAALQNYATGENGESQLRSFFLNSRNPDTSNNFNVLQGDKKELTDLGYDGMIYAPEGIDARNFEVKVFEPTQIKSATDNNGEFDANNPDIRFARKIDPESQELFDDAKERFGTTNDIREAGYVLPDGTMLDFSGRHWADPKSDNSWMNGMRQVDHRDIQDLNYEKDGNTPTGRDTNMSDFIRRGAIRISFPGAINLSTKPTWAQEDVLERLIRRDNRFVRVDFGDGNRSDHYADYDYASPAKIIDDIYGYFDDGIKPEGETRFRRSKEEVEKEARVSEAEAEYTNKTLDAMTPVVGAGVRRVTRDGMPKGHKTDKGYYDPATNNVYVCMDNVTDERDAVATVLHETVGYKGLGQLFGEQYRDTMARVYGALDNAGRTWVNGYIKANDLRLGDEGIVRAMAEYMARTAERDGGTALEDVNEVLGNVIDDLFGTDGFRFTDRELAYMLRASYEHMLNPGWLDTPAGRAKDTLMKRELGINETDPNKPTDPDGPGAGVRYRKGDIGVANADYNREVERKMTALITENQNADLPVKIGIEKVMKEVGMDRLAEDEDYLTRHNLASSRAETETHDFELFHFNPLKEQVKAIQEKLLGGKRRRGLEEAYQRILDYMYAVSALERNEWKRNETGEQRDFSGITSLMGRPKEQWKEAEDDAKRMIRYFRTDLRDAFWTDGKTGAEAEDEANAMLDELWNRVRSCTDFSLDHARKYGLITDEEYDRLHGTSTQPRMWNYYLPLRGFAERTAEEAYSYAGLTGRDSYAPGDDVVMKANGRWTEADNPLANILNIAQREIVQGNDNWARQALYNFAVRAGKNSLISVRKPWYEKVGKKWRLAVPEPDQSIESFEAEMKEKKDRGEARQGRAGAKNTPDNKLKLDMIMASKANANQHLIRLKVGGEDRMIWVNGNPAMARAVTGYGRKPGWELTRAASRVISNMFTTYSLDFTAKNLIRDSIYSRIALLMKEPFKYRWDYFKNWWDNAGYGAFAFPMIRLASMWESGELQRKPNKTKKEQLFIDFMHDGGKTGYTVMNSVKQIKRELDIELGGAKRNWMEKLDAKKIPLVKYYAMFVSTLNEAFELLTRFTAYQTSRQNGRSGQRAALDAKEISVNFNRRGAQSGEGFFGNVAAYLGATHYFYNAGVQGFDNFLRLFKANPVRMTPAAVALMGMGILTPLINSALAGAGDGDDDWYWNLPEWVRRNNIIIGWNTKKKGDDGKEVNDGSAYIALPLPVEFRAIYGLGDIAASAFAYNKYPNPTAGRLFSDVVSTAAGVLPVNPIEDISGSNNIADAALRAVVPDVTMFFVDWATNHDYTGRPLVKESTFTPNMPKSQAYYASTPLALVKACQAVGTVTGWDIAPGVARDFMNNYMGGFYKVAEDISKQMFTDDEHPRRWDDIPFLSGFTGHIDEDRTDTYVKNVLNAYRELSDGIVKDVNIRLNTKDVTDEMVYENPEQVIAMAKNSLQRFFVEGLLSGERYDLAKTYYEGTQSQGTGEYERVTRTYKTGKRAGKRYSRKEEIKIKGTEALRNEWNKLRKEWQAMPEGTAKEKSAKADKESEVEKAWQRYCDAQASLAEKLMAQEYDK